MKTCLFSLSFLEGFDKSGSKRTERMTRFIKYYMPLKDELGFDTLVIADNGSPEDMVLPFLHQVGYPALVTDNAHRLLHDPMDSTLRFLLMERLHFGTTFPKSDPRHHLDYPYCWRGFELIRKLFQSYDKVIFIDSDCYVLSGRLAEYIREFDNGWATLWCPRYTFPEATLQVIMKRPFEERYPKGPWELNIGRLMEWALPYTRIETKFVSDRYGETRVPVNDSMDYYSQAPIDIEMRYRG